MDLNLLTINAILAFLLILFRISGMMVSAPLFSMRGIPAQTKVGLSVTIALILFPLYAAKLVIPTDLIEFSVLAIQEVAIGLLIGFAASLIFTALQMAGEMISLQMGLSIASVLDPITHTQTPVMGQLLFYFAALLFLSLNVHHALILGVDRSFQWIPLGHFLSVDGLTGGMVAERFIRLTTDMFAAAMMIGVPFMGILLVSEIALSLVAKVMPQMNIFMVGMPLKVAVGLIALLMGLPYVSAVLQGQFHTLFKTLMGLYRF